VKVAYRQIASDDVVRQFRYYLLGADIPEVAMRFRDAVRRTVESLRHNPLLGPRYSSTDPELQNVRSWPVGGFESIRIYYILDAGAIQIIRVLHGKRDIKHILENKQAV